MSDDFFDKIDANLNKQKKANDVKVAEEEKNAAFVEALIPRLVEIGQNYAKKCEERGMTVEFKSYQRGVTFSLRYANGNIRSVSGSSDHQHQNKFSFEQHYPDNNGKRYKSMPMNWYDENNWKDEVFENQLKKLIEDFVFYADKFGGVK